MVAEVMERIRTTFDDIRTANRLAGEVFGAALDDMAPQTRTFLRALHDWGAEQCDRRGIDQADFRFTRREVRAVTGLSAERVHVHLERLVDLEYVVVHGGGTRGGRAFYELLYGGEGENGEKFLAGLADVDKLCAKYAGKNDANV